MQSRRSFRSVRSGPFDSAGPPRVSPLILCPLQLGTGMILAMDLFELGLVDVGVDLGSGKIGVAEELLNDP